MNEKPTYGELERRNRELEKKEGEHKQVEEALRESEKRLRIAGKASYDLIYEWDMTSDVLEWFGDIDGLLGYKPRVISRNIGAWLELIHPEDRGQLTNAVERHRNETMPIRYDYRIKHKDGSYRHWKDHGLPVLDKQDRPYKWIGVCADITEHKQAENVLRESDKKYRLLFDSIRDAIVVTDIDRNINACNLSFTQMFGYTFEEVKGKNTLCVYGSKEKYEAVGTEIRKNVERPFFSYTIPYKKKSGDLFFGETTVFFLKDDAGKVLGFIAVIRDISQRKIMEDSLMKANEDLEQKTVELENINTALDILLKKREQDIREMETKIFSNYESILLPFLNRLKNSLLNKNQQQLADLLEKGLKEILSPFAKKISDPLIMLTPTEIQIASMIKQGLPNKEIAQTLHCSIKTIDTHRANIRKKLDLKNKKINLRSCLLNL